VDNIEMALEEIVWDGMDMIYLSVERDWWRTLLNTGMNIQVL
jgi:hypothetical protein